jgi:Tol biopolymer transport system component
LWLWLKAKPPEIFPMDASDGSNVHLLVPNGFSPSWSPDGPRILFTREVVGGVDVYVINVDGSRLTQLTDDSARDVSATWSPDGQRIALVKASDGSGFGILYVMDADGSDGRLILGDQLVGDPR